MAGHHLKAFSCYFLHKDKDAVNGGVVVIVAVVTVVLFSKILAMTKDILNKKKHKSVKVIEHFIPWTSLSDNSLMAVISKMCNDHIDAYKLNSLTIKLTKMTDNGGYDFYVKKK